MKTYFLTMKTIATVCLIIQGLMLATMPDTYIILFSAVASGLATYAIWFAKDPK